MIKELKYLFYLIIIFFFIFFTARYYFSDENIKKFYRSISLIDDKINLIEKDLIFLDKKLSNPNFVKKAPVDIIEKDEQRKKSLSLKQVKLEIHLKTIEQGLC